MPPWGDHGQTVAEEQEWEARTIERHRADLASHLSNADVSMRIAQDVLDSLTGDTVYDLKFAEGYGSTDVAEHLRIAGFHLRAAQALVREAIR